MIHKINKEIENLLIDISSLIPLENNPRRGDVSAIAASYKEFGQVKPIVVRPNEDGTATVIAGNHQLQAAKSLGWTHIAAVKMNVEDDRAIAFALADNRTVELGHTEEDILFELLEQIRPEYFNLLDGLGWDDFEMAALDEAASYSVKTNTETGTGYIAPELIMPTLTQQHESAFKDNVGATLNENGDARLEAGEKIDIGDAVSMGTTAVGLSKNTKAVVQYTLVFDDAEQQRKWYDFIRFLRSSPVYEGDTTAQRLMEFISVHSEL